MAALDLRSRVSIAPGALQAEAMGEVVALDVERGFCYGLNRVGSHIWRLMAEPISVGDLCDRLVGEFQVERPTCERHVLDLLEDLRNEGLIAVAA